MEFELHGFGTADTTGKMLCGRSYSKLTARNVLCADLQC